MSRAGLATDPARDAAGGVIAAGLVQQLHPARPATTARPARQGVASFFFHPDYPLAELRKIVTGIKGLGYTFVPPTGLG